MLSLGLGSNCRAASSYHCSTGFSDTSFCSLATGSASSTGVSITYTPEQLLALGYEIDIQAQVDATFESVGSIIEASASASGGAGGLSAGARGAADPAGIVYVTLDPPLAHHYTGSMTAFLPVPEPGAPLLLAAGVGVLLAAGRTRRAG
jgi:hypothetical protein